MYTQGVYPTSNHTAKIKTTITAVVYTIILLVLNTQNPSF